MSKHSIQTYWEQVESGQLTNGKAALYRTIRNAGRMTTKEMASALNWKLSTITGRLSELMDEGLVHEIGSPGTYQCTTMEVMRAMHKTHRRQIRYQKWVALGKQNGWL